LQAILMGETAADPWDWSGFRKFFQ
jgi:hypothetical protein